MSISDEAAEARDSLSDDKELINTYEVKLGLELLFAHICVYICVFFFGNLLYSCIILVVIPSCCQ